MVMVTNETMYCRQAPVAGTPQAALAVPEKRNRFLYRAAQSTALCAGAGFLQTVSWHEEPGLYDNRPVLAAGRCEG